MTVPENIVQMTEKVLQFLAIREREELVGSIEFGQVRRPIEPEQGKPDGRVLISTES